MLTRMMLILIDVSAVGIHCDLYGRCIICVTFKLLHTGFLPQIFYAVQSKFCRSRNVITFKVSKLNFCKKWVWRLDRDLDMPIENNVHSPLLRSILKKNFNQGSNFEDWNMMIKKILITSQEGIINLNRRNIIKKFFLLDIERFASTYTILTPPSKQQILLFKCSVKFST